MRRLPGMSTYHFGVLPAPLLAALAAGLLALFAAASPAGAATTFTVNSTDDGADQNTANGLCDTGILIFPTGEPQCTLRAAIEQANATSGADTVNFDIPGSGVKTISPTSELPKITRPLTIDGYTQPGSSENTQAQGTDAVLLIELDGSNVEAAGPPGGLLLGSNASNSVIRGLVINRFAGGIYNYSSGTKIEGNFIGTDPSGTLGLGNGFGGVFISSAANNTVGGTSPDKRNLISGNGDGVNIGSGSRGNKVQGNLTGTKKDGASALGNFRSSVYILGGADNNVVGGTTSGAANVIAFNGGDGIILDTVSGDSPTGNRILGNSIFSNGDLGIDLENASSGGPTLIDHQDPDTGANRLQNFPVISSATVSGGQINITGMLNSTPSPKGKKKRKVYTIQFFSSPQADPSSYGEGKTFIGQTTVVTSRTGYAFFDSTFTPSQPVSPGETVAATATRNSTGDTSEFSEVEVVS